MTEKSYYIIKDEPVIFPHANVVSDVLQYAVSSVLVYTDIGLLLSCTLSVYFLPYRLEKHLNKLLFLL